MGESEWACFGTWVFLEKGVSCEDGEKSSACSPRIIGDWRS